MPVDSMLVSAAVVAMFVVFAAVLAWGEFQTRPKQHRAPLRERAGAAVDPLTRIDATRFSKAV
jgi:hypothetical protein